MYVFKHKETGLALRFNVSGERAYYDEDYPVLEAKFSAYGDQVFVADFIDEYMIAVLKNPDNSGNDICYPNINGVNLDEYEVVKISI